MFLVLVVLLLLAHDGYSSNYETSATLVPVNGTVTEKLKIIHLRTVLSISNATSVEHMPLTKASNITQANSTARSSIDNALLLLARNGTNDSRTHETALSKEDIEMGNSSKENKTKQTFTGINPVERVEVSNFSEQNARNQILRNDKTKTNVSTKTLMNNILNKVPYKGDDSLSIDPQRNGNNISTYTNISLPQSSDKLVNVRDSESLSELPHTQSEKQSHRAHHVSRTVTFVERDADTGDFDSSDTNNSYNTDNNDRHSSNSNNSYNTDNNNSDSSDNKDHHINYTNDTKIKVSNSSGTRTIDTNRIDPLMTSVFITNKKLVASDRQTQELQQNSTSTAMTIRTSYVNAGTTASSHSPSGNAADVRLQQRSWNATAFRGNAFLTRVAQSEGNVQAEIYSDHRSQNSRSFNDEKSEVKGHEKGEVKEVDQSPPLDATMRHLSDHVNGKYT